MHVIKMILHDIVYILYKVYVATLRRGVCIIIDTAP